MASKKGKDDDATIPADEKTKRKIVFSREKILSMSRYGERHDLLSVVLENGKSYELQEVDALIKDFMKED